MSAPHEVCLGTVSVLLNRAQDIEDAIRDFEHGGATATATLERIREINNKSLDEAASYLPG